MRSKAKEDYHTSPDEWDEENDDFNEKDDDDAAEEDGWGTFKLASRWTTKNPFWAYLAWECGAR